MSVDTRSDQLALKEGGKKISDRNPKKIKVTRDQSRGRPSGGRARQDRALTSSKTSDEASCSKQLCKVNFRLS